MERFVLKKLLAWKASPYRKPLILKGVRQVRPFLAASSPASACPSPGRQSPCVFVGLLNRPAVDGVHMTQMARGACNTTHALLLFPLCVMTRRKSLFPTLALQVIIKIRIFIFKCHFREALWPWFCRTTLTLLPARCAEAAVPCAMP